MYVNINYINIHLHIHDKNYRQDKSGINEKVSRNG